MSCDICGKVGVPLQQLRKEFHTEYISDVCKDCERIINPKRDKIYLFANSMHYTLVKEFITEMKAKFSKEKHEQQ